MKKFLVLLVVILTLSVNTQAENFKLKAFSMTHTANGQIHTNRVDIDIYLNFETSRCVIFSNSTQIIDFKAIRTYLDADNFTVMECSATDTNYNNIEFEILSHATENKVMILISYNDLTYIYSCYVADE